jgi:putative endonuclease
MPTSGQIFGKHCEYLAKTYLEAHGYSIVDMNYRTPFGEIDIIAEENQSVVFIEVKARRSVRYGGAKYAVHLKKQQKMIQSALFYLQQTKQSHIKFRFDVAAIQVRDDRYQIELIKNAIQSQDM